MDGWMDGWMDEWVDGWMDGWMGGYCYMNVDQPITALLRNVHQ